MKSMIAFIAFLWLVGMFASDTIRVGCYKPNPYDLPVDGVCYVTFRYPF